MIMLVMCVGKVGVRMSDWLMLVFMAMLHTRHHREIMAVLMVYVVDVFMVMLNGHMRVRMIVLLGKMQPYPHRHQNACA